MVQTLVALVVLGALVGAIFLGVWLADAQRADDVENDEERLHTDEHLTDDNLSTDERPRS